MKHYFYLLVIGILVCMLACIQRPDAKRIDIVPKTAESTILFKSLLKMPDGSHKFGLVFDDLPIQWAGLGDEVEGFTIEGFDLMPDPSPPGGAVVGLRGLPRLKLLRNGKRIHLIHREPYHF